MQIIKVKSVCQLIKSKLCLNTLSLKFIPLKLIVLPCSLLRIYRQTFFKSIDTQTLYNPLHFVWLKVPPVNKTLIHKAQKAQMTGLKREVKEVVTGNTLFNKKKRLSIK